MPPKKRGGLSYQKQKYTTRKRRHDAEKEETDSERSQRQDNANEA